MFRLPHGHSAAPRPPWIATTRGTARRIVTAAIVMGPLASPVAAAEEASGADRVERPASATASAQRLGDARQLPEVRVTATTLADDLTEGSDSYTAPRSSAATGLGLSLRETPQSVTVITRQRMDDQGLDNLGQVVNETTGITFQPTGSLVGGYSAMYARGYQVTTLRLDGVMMPLALYGGAWQGWNALDSAIFDSVTVVRGATGLITGAGDPSGTVSVVRKRPTETFQASLSQSAARWNQWRTTADIGGPLNEAGSLRGRLVATYNQGGTWQDRYRQYRSLAYGILEADLGSRTRASVQLEHDRQTGKAGAPYTGFDLAFTDGTPTRYARTANSLTDWSHTTNRRTLTTLGLEHRLADDWITRLSYSHGRLRNQFQFGYAGVGQPDPDGMSDLMVRWGRGETRVDVVDFNINGHFQLLGRRHDVVAGLTTSRLNDSTPLWFGDFAFDRVQTLDWSGRYPEPDFESLATPSSRTSTKESGLYLATRLKPLDSLSVLAGGRWSRWSTKQTDIATGSIDDDRRETGVFTPYVGVVYDLNRQLSVYASYTEVFNPQSNEDVNGRILDPESGKNHELGVKGEWLGGRLNASAAVFEVRKDNLAVEDGNLTPDGNPSYVALDDTKGRGWEVDVAGQLLPGWSLQAGYARVVTRDGTGADIGGGLPKHQFKLFTTWKPAPLPALTLGGGLYWQSRFYSTFADAALRDVYTQKAFSVVNLMGRYAFSRSVSLSLNLNNVFDKAYRTEATRHEYGMPRSLMATLRYQY